MAFPGCLCLWNVELPPFSQQERLKATEQRVEMEEKVSKRNLDTAKSSLTSSSSGLLHSKPPVLSPSTSAPYSKVVSPPPLSPRTSPVSVPKAEVIQKLEEPPSQPAYSYPATPISHQSSPRPASPPPAPAVPPKEEEELLESVEKKELEKDNPSPFQALFPGKENGKGPPPPPPLGFEPLSCFLLCLSPWPLTLHATRKGLSQHTSKAPIPPHSQVPHQGVS